MWLKMAGPYAVANLCQRSGMSARPGTACLLVAPSDQIHSMRQYFAEMGLRAMEPQADRFAFTRHLYTDPATGIQIRVAFDRLETDTGTIPVMDRLTLPGHTLPPSELLLSRLGWSIAIERHLHEAQCLLERFEVVGNDEVEGINGSSFALRARSSPSLEITVTRRLDAIADRQPPGSSISERVQLLKVWLKSSRGLTIRSITESYHSLYRNWIYPADWM